MTSLKQAVLAVAQLYRDRGDAANPFDELRHQWGWAGFTTHDLYRCQAMARHIALIYNWLSFSCDWPSRSGGGRPSPAGRCGCTPWPR